MKLRSLLVFLRLFFAALLLLAAVSKLTDYNSFRLFIGAHEFVPVPLISLLTAGIPGLELTLAFALLFIPEWRPLVPMVFGLMGAFLIYQMTYRWAGAGWGFPLEGTCKCMKLPQAGGLDTLSPVIRNFVFLVLAAGYFFLERRNGRALLQSPPSQL